MSDVPSDEKFLARWSRRKVEARAQAPEGTEPSAASAAPDATATETPPEPPLPPVEAIDLRTDVTGFLRPGVDAGLKRRALSKLFHDPHFNVMDGLDVYIDDYGKPDPLPPEMLAALRFARDYVFRDPTRPEAPGAGTEASSGLEPDRPAEAASQAATPNPEDQSTAACETTGPLQADPGEV